MAAGKREFCGISLIYCGLCPTSFRRKKRKREGKREKGKEKNQPKNPIKNLRKLKPEDTSHLASQSDGTSLFQLALIFAASPSESVALPQDLTGKSFDIFEKKKGKDFQLNLNSKVRRYSLNQGTLYAY